MKKKVKVIGGIVLGALAALGITATVLAPLSLEVTVLESTTARVTFTEQGSYQYDRSLTVYPQFAGEVLQVKVSQGEAVKKGDTLAVISASDYEAEIKSLESVIAGYNAQIENLRVQEQENKNVLISNRETILGQIAELDVGVKGYNITEESLERQIELQESIIEQNFSLARLTREDLKQAREDYDDGIIEQAQYNAARSAYNLAETTLEASRQQLEQMKTGNVTKESYETQISSLETQLALVEQRIGGSTTYAMSQYYNALIEGARQNISSMTEKLGQANITAPVDGIVSELPVINSNLVSQQSSIATIGSNPIVEVFIPIREIDGVKPGDRVELIVNKRLGDETLPGTVMLVEDEAKVRLSALGVEERKIRVLVNPESDSLRIGFNMDVKFTVLEQSDCVIVPKTAVFLKDGQDMVWVIDNDVVKSRAIGKGVETREGYAVTFGLSSGDAVVSDANTEGVAEGKRANRV